MRYCLPVTAVLLAGIGACGVVPTDLESAVAEHPAPAGGLAAVRAAVDDPLMHALVSGLDETAARAEVARALAAVSQADVLPSLEEALRTAHARIAQVGAVDDGPARAALTLVLEYVGATMADRTRDTDGLQRRVAR
jgi:hypothetical protein